MSWDEDSLKGFETEYEKWLEHGKASTGDPEFDGKLQAYEQNALWFSIGGPAQTLLTSSVGILILLLRKTWKRKSLRWPDWLGVFLALFCLREIFNLAFSISKGILGGYGLYFGGDEANISRMMGWHYGTLSITLGLLAVGIGAWVVFGIVPRRLRVSFILAGITGGLLSYGLWMMVLGPIILPRNI